MPSNQRWSESTRIPPDQLGGWQSLLREQHGVVSLGQLRSYGHSHHDIKANVEAGRWQRMLPRTYATFTGKPGRAAKTFAAILYGGAHSALSHRTAAEEWGIAPIKEGTVEITVPYTSSATSQLPLVEVHRSRAVRHITLATRPPRTRRTDTIVDLAVAAETAQAALYLVVDMVSRHAVSVPEMLACVECRPPRRYRSVIAQGLDLVRRGLMSALEVE